MVAVLGLLDSAIPLDGSEPDVLLDGVAPGLFELARKHQHQTWE